jgi:hypothetical protein
MPDVIEVSYTGDLLAHRRCRRAWAYEKRVGFLPYEAVQAMEGRLVHHGMQWLTRQFHEINGRQRHATADELRTQLDRHFRVLWARGIKTAFASRQDTLDRVMGNLYPNGKIDIVVKAVIEGAQHTEYELRAVKKVLPADFGGKSRILLTGVLDLVIQQQEPLTYARIWRWDSVADMQGHVHTATLHAQTGDEEIWDYKATRAKTVYMQDYVRQVLTYAALYKDRRGHLPKRCVLFFVNEPAGETRLLAMEVSENVVQAALLWTQVQVKRLQETVAVMQRDPRAIIAGELDRADQPLGSRLTPESQQQCTACQQRFDCDEYIGSLKGGSKHPDVDLYNVQKN